LILFQIDASFKENVDCLGYVPDLADIYFKSRVAICPLITGDGTKFKLVEAMAYAMPIIALKKSMSWYRMRRGVGGKPDPIEYKEKTEKPSKLKKLEDESSFYSY
jgi:glycosyltransferase involved in cell wall biosynthesis